MRRLSRGSVLLCSLLLLLSTSVFAQQRGGNATVLLPEDLATLNPYLSTAFITLQVSPAILEPLVGIDPNGDYYPVLAAEVPTPDNGGVSADGLTVTWKLKPDVTWSDGETLVADDVVFTSEAASASENGSVRSGAYAKVESVTAIDDQTVEVRYREFDSSYLDLFQWGILPRHAAGDAGAMNSWEFNRSPVGTGPFVLDEWRAGDRITMSRNENYREEGKPYLDGVTFLVVPSEETRVAMMTRGDAERMLWPSSTQREAFESSPDTRYELVPSIWILRMFLNLGERNNPVDGQAPHPILGDPRVRQALAYGIDYDLLIDDLAEGRVTRATSPFMLAWYACDLPGYAYDPEKAAALLDEAGWRDEDGDGIREAHGAEYAADGTKLTLDMTGYTDFRLLEQTELVIQDLYKDLGIDLQVRNVEQSVLFGGWGDRAARKTGDFDILIYDTGAGINPQGHVYELLHSSRIPRQENDGGGGNYSRYANADVDRLLDSAGTEPSLSVRHDAYCQIAEQIDTDLPQIYLFQFQDGNAMSNRLKGVTPSTWEGIAWDIEGWWLE